MPITDWPEAERPREKLLALGPGALSDAELLAIFLRTGVPGQTAVALARSLIAEFGSLPALFQADGSRRQIQLIVQHQHVLGLQLIEVEHTPHRLAALVHISMRFK